MPAPQSVDEFVESLSSTDLLSAAELETLRTDALRRQPPPTVESFASELVQAGKLTKFQAAALCAGKVRAIHCGEYVLLDKIGAGGMGQVFKARHRRMKRIVAVKLLTPRGKGQEQAIKRFYQEVELAGRLVHPNIVTAYDAGEANNLHYLVMEFVEGQDLSSLLKPNKQLPVAEAIDVTLQAARGLQYAHDQGIVHRDIKPSNLLRDVQGNVKILDMGLARSAAALSETETAARDGLTQSGEVMGTVDYMAPEQARNTREADARSDIYSLGCTLYRLVTGTVPFQGDSLLAKIMAHCEQPVPRLADKVPAVPPRLDQLVQRMLAKKPEERPQTMAEVAAELESCHEEVRLPAPAKPPSPAERTATNLAGGSSVKLSELPQLPGQSRIGLGSSLAGSGGSAIGREPAADGPGSSAIRHNAVPAPTRTRPAPRAKAPSSPAGSSSPTPTIAPIIQTCSPSAPADALKNADGEVAPQVKMALLAGGGVFLLLMVAFAIALGVAMNRPAEPAVAEVEEPAVTPPQPAPVAPQPLPQPMPPVLPPPTPMAAEPSPLPMVGQAPMLPAEEMPPTLPPPAVPPPPPVPQPMGKPAEPAAPARFNGRIDLLQLIDLKRDTVDGAWALDGHVLVAPVGGGFQRFQFPFSLPGNYELRLRFETATSGGHLAIGLPTAAEPTSLVLAFDRTLSAGLHLKRANWNNNETTIRDVREFAEPQSAEAVCRVEAERILVESNGRRLITFEGDQSQLHNPSVRSGPDPRKFCLQTSGVAVRFTRCEVIPLGQPPASPPAGESLDEATAKADALAGPALAAAASVPAKAAEARRLQALAAPLDDAAAAYVLLQRALQLAVDAADVELTCSLCEDQARFYGANGDELLRGALNKMAATPASAPERLDLARRMLVLAEQHDRCHRFAVATELLPVAETICTRARDLVLAKEARIRAKECKDRQVFYEAMVAARETLKSAPDDGPANTAIGNYFATVRKSFEDALPYYEQSHLPLVRAAAQLEQRFANDPNKPGAIGEAWGEAGETLDGPTRTQAFLHARSWFERGTAGASAPALKRLSARFARDEQDVDRLHQGAHLNRHPLDAYYFDGKWYKFYSSVETWWSARRKCRALGGDLVCVETPNEHQFLCQFALAQFGNPDRFYVWLGATEEGHEEVYTWVSGSPVVFNAWAPNYPSKNVVGGAIFLAREAGGGARFHWMDTVPTQKYCYICEWSR